jgi:hypothetical protein
MRLEKTSLKLRENTMLSFILSGKGDGEETALMPETKQKGMDSVLDMANMQEKENMIE